MKRDPKRDLERAKAAFERADARTHAALRRLHILNEARERARLRLVEAKRQAREVDQ